MTTAGGSGTDGKHVTSSDVFAFSSLPLHRLLTIFTEVEARAEYNMAYRKSLRLHAQEEKRGHDSTHRGPV